MRIGAPAIASSVKRGFWKPLRPTTPIAALVANSAFAALFATRSVLAAPSNPIDSTRQRAASSPSSLKATLCTTPWSSPTGWPRQLADGGRRRASRGVVHRSGSTARTAPLRATGRARRAPWPRSRPAESFVTAQPRAGGAADGCLGGAAGSRASVGSGEATGDGAAAVVCSSALTVGAEAGATVTGGAATIGARRSNSAKRSRRACISRSTSARRRPLPSAMKKPIGPRRNAATATNPNATIKRSPGRPNRDERRPFRRVWGLWSTVRSLSQFGLQERRARTRGRQTTAPPAATARRRLK